MYVELLDLADKTKVPPLGNIELTKAIGHLYKSLELITGAKHRIEKGIFDGVFTSNDLAQGWFEVNCCRIYTETMVIIEEYLQPAMGLISDAKSMIDSLVAWGLGMTLHGKMHIIGCLEEAESSIQAVLGELESWLTTQPSDFVCTNCGRKYTYGDKYCSACGHPLD